MSTHYTEFSIDRDRYRIRRERDSSAESSMSSIDGPVTYVQREAPRYSAAMTVRAKAQSTGIGEELHFNPRYFATISGIIKLVQLVSARAIFPSAFDSH